MAVFTPAWVVNDNDMFVGGIFATLEAAEAFAAARLPNGGTPVSIIPVTRVTEDPE